MFSSFGVYNLRTDTAPAVPPMASCTTAPTTPDYEGAMERVDRVLDDLGKGLVHRPQRERLSRAVGDASKGDKVNDAITRSIR